MVPGHDEGSGSGLEESCYEHLSANVAYDNIYDRDDSINSENCGEGTGSSLAVKVVLDTICID